MPHNQLSFKSIPNEQASAEFVQSKAWQEMVELGGRICQLLGVPRSTGQIYGLVYLSTEPLSLTHMSTILGISKASVSMGTRQLISCGAIRKVWIPGDRRDYYELVEDLGRLISGNYNNLIKPRIQSAKNRINTLKSKLNEDFESEAIPSNKKEILKQRIKVLEKIQNKISKFMPIAERIIGSS